MPDKDLSTPVKAFLYRYIRSVEHLEILGALSGGQKSTWSVEEMYSVILSTRKSVEAWLDELAKSGLANRLEGGDEPRFQYHAQDDELHWIVSQTVEAYRQLPVRVIETIYRRDRDPAQGFADAFKFKTD